MLPKPWIRPPVCFELRPDPCDAPTGVAETTERVWALSGGGDL